LNSLFFTELDTGNNAGKRAGLETDNLDPVTPKMIALERYIVVVCRESFKFEIRNIFL
jgi:hypothetical protein